MKPLVELTKYMAGQSYELGKVDCFRIIYDYIERTGEEVPKDFQGLTLETYKDEFEKNPDNAKDIMVQFFERYLEEVPLGHGMPGDVILVTHKDFGIFPALDAGNGLVFISAPDYGTITVPVRHYKVERIFRCPQQHPSSQ